MQIHYIILAAICQIFAILSEKKTAEKTLMLLKQMGLRAFSVGSVLNNILHSAFCTTQRKSHKGLFLLFSLVFLSVLFCRVLLHAWLTTISILFKTVILLLIILQIKYPKVDPKAHEINCCCVLLLQIALQA